MAASRYDFTNGNCGMPCERGATFYKKFNWSTESAPDTYIPVDLTGFTAKMKIKTDFGGTEITELNTANSKIVLGGVLGDIELKLTSNETLALPAGNYRYDLELTSPTAEVTRLIEGYFEVKDGITL